MTVRFPRLCAKDSQRRTTLTDAKLPSERALENKTSEASKKRLLKAYLDVAILAELAEREAMSASHIISYFESKFNVSLSPGTVYPALRKMEQTGDIKRLLRRRIKFYFVTKNGLDKLDAFQKSIEKTEDMLSYFLKVRLSDM